VYPNKNKHCGFYIRKDAADSDNFTVKLDVAIEASDKTIVWHHELERKSNLIGIGFGWGWGKFMKTEDILNEHNKFLANDSLTFVISVSLV
jgi:hypothetical protein